MAAAHQGFEVKAQGDGFMVAFSSGHRAMLCAIAIQREFARYNSEAPQQEIRVRIGLHTGEAIKEENEFFGTAVIFAARIANQARGGEILASALVKELTDGGSDLRFGEARSVRLHGFSDARTLVPVLWTAGPDEARA